MRLRLLLLLLATALIGGGVVAYRSSRADHAVTVRLSAPPPSDVVPWVDRPAPAPGPTTTTTLAARECRARQLRLGSGSSGIAAGSTIWSYPLSNTGPDCALRGSTKVTALDAGGQRVVLDIGSPDGPPVNVLGRESTDLMFQVPNTCDGAGLVMPADRYRDVALIIGGESISVPRLDLVLCGRAVGVQFGCPREDARPAPP